MKTILAIAAVLAMTACAPDRDRWRDHDYDRGGRDGGAWDDSGDRRGDDQRNPDERGGRRDDGRRDDGINRW